MQGLSNEIIFKVGIKYMSTFNVDVGDGLVKGACGILRYLTMGRIVGLIARQKFKEYTAASGINEELIPTAKSTAIITMHKNCCHQIMRKQFPVVPAVALTIHKSQGQTYEAVCLDFRRLKRE